MDFICDGIRRGFAISWILTSVVPRSNGTVRIFSRALGRDAFIRSDRPHRGARYYHINTNSAYSGVRDPHSRISMIQFIVRFIVYIIVILNILFS